MIATLVDVGYDGSVGLEYFPSGPDEDPLASVRRVWPTDVAPLEAPHRITPGLA